MTACFCRRMDTSLTCRSIHRLFRTARSRWVHRRARQQLHLCPYRFHSNYELYNVNKCFFFHRSVISLDKLDKQDWFYMILDSMEYDRWKPYWFALLELFVQRRKLVLSEFIEKRDFLLMCDVRDFSTVGFCRFC